MVPPLDRWSRWLLERRDGGDKRQRELTLDYLSGVRDRVLGPDRSVDVVTTRSVPIYVTAKPPVFAAFPRLLRPGGRIALFEPITRLMFPEPDDRFSGYDLSAVGELTARVCEAAGRFDGDTYLDGDDGLRRSRSRPPRPTGRLRINPPRMPP